jgi:phosphoglycolate phosphatase-like HAD superfamily hydrolase
MVKLVLFDIDGTLIRTGGAGVRAFAEALRSEFNLPNATDGMRFAGRTDTGILREALVRGGVAPSAENFERFFSAYAHWLAHKLTQTRGEICPSIPTLLGDMRRLRNPPTFGLLTGNIRLGAEIKLRHFQLWDHFETGAFADDHEDRNHIAAKARDRAAELMGIALAGEEILVVGDTPMDIECGRAIGAKVLAVATGGYKRHELEPHRPDWLAGTAAEIDAREVCGQ